MRPDLPSTETPEDVLGRWARGHPDAANLPARRPGHAAIARVWMLGDSYVLRARDLSASTIVDFHRETALLARVRSLLPCQVPTNLPADDGQGFVVADDALWTLHRMLPGRILRPWQDLHHAQEDERRRLVRAMRGLHDATAGLAGLPGDADWLVVDAGRRYAEVRQTLPGGVRARVETALQRHAGHVAALAPAEAVFVHGDFHWGNLLLDPTDRVTGLLDLDWCRIGSPVEDLAYTAMMLARDCDTLQPPEHAGAGERIAQQSLDGAGVASGRSNAPRLEEPERVMSWYGLPQRHHRALHEAMILYALFDVHLFTNAAGLAGRTRYLDCQLRLLEAFCTMD
jgi:aminoglycoside phosphotransferase (APT) family kinase protein